MVFPELHLLSFLLGANTLGGHALHWLAGGLTLARSLFWQLGGRQTDKTSTQKRSLCNAGCSSFSNRSLSCSQETLLANLIVILSIFVGTRAIHVEYYD